MVGGMAGPIPGPMVGAMPMTGGMPGAMLGFMPGVIPGDATPGAMPGAGQNLLAPGMPMEPSLKDAMRLLLLFTALAASFKRVSFFLSLVTSFNILGFIATLGLPLLSSTWKAT